MISEEQITGLIEKINNVISQAPEFKERLMQELFGDIVPHESLNISNNQNPDFGKKINAITKYLALDNQLDNAVSTIDYSWVKDKFTKEQLVADFREMLRYRWNCRSHKADFLEFCKFAHFQIEGLLNYYYRTVCRSNLDKIKLHISNYYKNAKLDYCNSLESIGFRTKKIAYCNEAYKETNYKAIAYLLNLRIDIICSIRNVQSHRNLNNESVFLDTEAYRKDLENLGLSFNSYGELKYSSNNNFKIEQKKDNYYEYHKLIYIKNEYFDLVFDTIRSFSENMRDNISTII